MSDRTLLARYPYLPGSEQLLEGLDVNLSELLEAPPYEPARQLAKEELRRALRSSPASARTTGGRLRAWSLSSPPPPGRPAGPSSPEGRDASGPEDRALAWLYERMLLASAASPQLATRRWSEGTAREVAERWEREGTPREELVRYGEALDLHLRVDPAHPAYLFFSLPSYVHLTSRMRDPTVRLVAQEVRAGEVRVRAESALRLLEEGTRIYLAEELDLLTLDPTLRDRVREREPELLAEVASRVPVATAGGFGPVLRPELFPPCMRDIRAQLSRAQPMAHAGRFALASFMHKVGADVEAIVDAYRGASNFKEGLTRYQVTQISRHDGGAGYTPPDCATLLANGLCRREQDEARPSLCADPSSLKNPLNYYRLRLRQDKERGPPAPPASPTAPSGDPEKGKALPPAEGSASTAPATSTGPSRAPSPG